MGGLEIFFLLRTSVTRFGEKSPLWQNFKIFGQVFKGSFSIKKNFELELANYFNFGTIFIVANLIIIWLSGHTALYLRRISLGHV